MNQEKSTNKNSVYDDIRRKIQKGEMASGEWLAERELSELYGLSRTPMREVLWHLEKDGLLVQTPGRGFRIRELKLQEIMEIFQAREAVEGMAAYLVSHLQGNTFFDEIKKIRLELESVEESDLQETGPVLGSRMHNLIMDYTKNTILNEFYFKLHSMYSLTVNITRKSHDIEKVSRDYHLKIMEAIEAHDGVSAEKHMREHLRITCRNIMKIFYPNLIN